MGAWESRFFSHVFLLLALSFVSSRCTYTLPRLIFGLDLDLGTSVQRRLSNTSPRPITRSKMQMRDLFTRFALAAAPLQEHPLALLPGTSVIPGTSPNLRLTTFNVFATCDVGWVTCGAACMPAGSICCSGQGYCDAGEYCTDHSTCCPVRKIHLLLSLSSN